jgi:hypothetical protein
VFGFSFFLVLLAAAVWQCRRNDLARICRGLTARTTGVECSWWRMLGYLASFLQALGGAVSDAGPLGSTKGVRQRERVEEEAATQRAEAYLSAWDQRHRR